MSRLHEKLKSGELAIGTCVGLGSMYTTELLGDAGLDYVWIDGEHCALSLRDIQDHLIAAKASGASGIVRIPWNDAVLVKPVLDMGAEGIIFPMICTGEEAKSAVESCRYPMNGIRGFGPRRANKYGLISALEYSKITEQTQLKIMQIEHIDAYKNIDDIIAVEGIDAFLIGPNDFQSSLGNIGLPADEETNKIYDDMCAKFVAAKIPFGVAGGFSPAFVEQWIKRGAAFINLGFDYAFVAQGAKNIIEGTKKVQASLAE